MADLIDRSYYNAFANARSNKQRSLANDLMLQQTQRQMDQEQNVNNALAQLPGPGASPAEQQNYATGLSRLGPGGMRLAQEVMGMWDQFDARDKATFRKQLEDETKLLMLASNPDTYQTAIQEVAKLDPERARNLPPEWNEKTAQIIQGRVNKLRTIEQILGNYGQSDPADVKTFKYRQSLPEDQREEFDKTRRSIQVVNSGGKQRLFDSAGNPIGEYDYVPKVTETPEYKSAVTKAIEETKQAVKATAQQSGREQSYQTAKSLYNNLKAGNLDKIYGYGERWYPEFLRSQEGINLMAQRDQLVAMLQLAASGQLKGQGQISEGERAILRDSASVLANPNIGVDLARSAIDDAFAQLSAAAGRQVTTTDDGWSITEVQ